MKRLPILFLTLIVALSSLSPASAGQREKVFVTSSIDGTKQPCYVILPEAYDASGPPVALLVSLHTWSGDVEQRRPHFEREAEQRGWIYIFPHFRGANRSPDACGSEKARQDILDATDWAIEHYGIDSRRIYLVGTSGGGHMAMLMAGKYPHRWTAVSAWVGISDLAAWHALQADGGYGRMLRASCGGAPGDSAEVDREYRRRSPTTWLHQAVQTPLDLAAGVHDGHKGSVPIRHTLEAFNIVAEAGRFSVVTEAEIEQLSRPNGRLDKPQPQDRQADSAFGREIYLRRTAGRARVTIFEGGHEGLAPAAMEWLARHAKESTE